MEDYRIWYNHAKEDLSAAKYNIKGRKYRIAAFLCQQAAEKALKALHIKKIGKYPRIHDLVVLGEKVNVPEDLMNRMRVLNSVYIESRYPDPPTGEIFY